MPRLRRRLAHLAVILAGLILIGLAGLQLPPVRQRALAYVRDYASRELGITISASSLDYSLLARSIELRDVSLTAVSAGQPFLRADRAVVVLDRGLFVGRIAVNRISVSRPQLTLVRNADGSMNLPASPRSGQPASPVQLGVISITSGSAQLDDRASQRSFAIGPLDVSIDTAGAQNAPGAFGPGPFTIRAGDVATSGTIEGRLSFDGSRVRLEHLTATTSEGRIAIDGWADVIAERPALSSHLSATIDLARAARLARVDLPGLAGRLDATVNVAGAFAAPAIALEGAVTSATGLVHVNGTVGARTHLALRWTNVRVDDLARTLGHPLPLASGSLASGSGALDFDARDLDARAWSRMRADAATSLRPTADPAAADALALSGTVDLRLDRGLWSLRHSLRVATARADLAGTVTGQLPDRANGAQSALGGRTRVRAEDIGATLPLMHATGIRLPPAVTKGLSGAMQATVDLGGTMASPNARIDVGIRDLRAQSLPHAAEVDARLSADAGGMRVTQLHATTGTSVLQGSGRFQWSGPLEARVDISQGDVSELASHFRAPVGVSGSARMEGTLSGTAAALHANLTLAARDVAVEQVRVGPLTATATLDLADDGLMRIDATAPALGARADVEIVNRAGYPLSGQLTVDQNNVAELIPPQYRQQIGSISGRLKATARGSGRLSDPAGIRGRVDFAALDVAWRGTRVALTSPGTVLSTTDRIAVDRIDLRVGERLRVTVDGQLGTTELPDALRIHLDGPLSELIDIGSRTAGAQPADVRGDGTATLDATVRGTLSRPLPTGTLTVRSPSLAYGTWPAVTDVMIEAGIDPTIITLRTLGAQWQGASIAGEGLLPWRVVLESSPLSSRLAGWLRALPAEPARARLTVRADNVTQRTLAGIVAPERLRDIEGNLSARLAFDADRLSLDGIHGTAVLDRASLTLAGVAFTQRVPTRVTLDEGRAGIDDFQWSAEGNSIVATGGVRLTATPAAVDIGLSGTLNLRALGAFLPDVRPSGRAQTDVTITGPLDDPDIVGRIHVSDGELQWDTPRLAASDLEGTIDVGAGRHASIALVGSINTGTATLDGTIDLADFAKPVGKLQITGNNVALEYPSGLQTESNVDVAIAFNTSRSTVTGRIEVLGGTYREPLMLSRQLLNLSSSTNGIVTAAPPDWMSRVGLDVALTTTSDIRIDNNYGRLDAGAALRVTGTAARPGVVGRLEAADGGEIYLGGNTYRVERLAIDLTNPRDITPEVSFAAQTRVGDLPIGIELLCPAAGPCERKVTSLSTGVDDKEAEARLLGTAGTPTAAGENLARLLSGELLGVVGRTVGLDVLRLEQSAQRRDIFDDPTLISGDVDPAARLTLAKRVGANVELVFSQNLADEGFTWSTTYLGPYGLSGRLLILDDQSRAYEFRHEPPLGAAARARRRPSPPGPRVTAVTIAGTPVFPDHEIRRQLRLTKGHRFTFGAWQRDRDRLERFYHTRDFREARIRARRLQAQPADGSVVLEYTITRGPQTQLVVRGTTLPDAVRDRIFGRWTSALFDGFLEKDARTIVREHLYRLGYLHATVSAAVVTDARGDRKTLTIDVVGGSIVSSRIEMTGNSAVPTEQLLRVIDEKDALSPWLDPASVKLLLETLYRSEGFLAADVSVDPPQDLGGMSVVAIHVVEGRPFAIGAIELIGVPQEAESESREQLALSQGDRYRPASVADGIARLEARVTRAAYRQSRVDVVTRMDADAARVDLSIRVTPGPRSILRDVVVKGGDARKPAIARSIALETGAPVDVDALAETRRRLTDLDIYRSVDVQVQPIAPDASSASGGVPAEQPVTARIALEERPRYRLRYGLAINDEETGPDERDQRLGFAADFENRNVFGRGVSAGVSLRLRQDQQVGRVTVGARRFLGLPIRSTVFVEKEREQLDPGATFPTTSNISTITAEQAYRLGAGMEWRYGYGFERNHTFIESQGPDPFDVKVNIARFTTNGLVDRRNDAFNPARGWFVSSALELSKPALGSDLSFLKDFSQSSYFVPLPRGIVLASAARLGLARTFDGEVLIPSERFYAGGANSVRGYREGDLGARSVLDDPEGGSALLVLNAELRFPVLKRVGGVGFLDAGNVYSSIRDISLGDLHVGSGAGVRLDTPFGLIRFDVGVPLNRRPSDPHWRFHFGLGHAF